MNESLIVIGAGVAGVVVFGRLRRSASWRRLGGRVAGRNATPEEGSEMFVWIAGFFQVISAGWIVVGLVTLVF